MSGCIWVHYARPRPHWYSLSDGERASRKAQWEAAAVQSRHKGGERIGIYHIRGQHDFETSEIWRFANAEAAFEHWACLTALGYGEWFAFANNVGLAMETDP